jgi:hypothetical protein
MVVGREKGRRAMPAGQPEALFLPLFSSYIWDGHHRKLSADIHTQIEMMSEARKKSSRRTLSSLPIGACVCVKGLSSTHDPLPSPTYPFVLVSQTTWPASERVVASPSHLGRRANHGQLISILKAGFFFPTKFSELPFLTFFPFRCRVVGTLLPLSVGLSHIIQLRAHDSRYPPPDARSRDGVQPVPPLVLQPRPSRVPTPSPTSSLHPPIPTSLLLLFPLSLPALLEPCGARPLPQPRTDHHRGRPEATQTAHCFSRPGARRRPLRLVRPGPHRYRLPRIIQLL